MIIISINTTAKSIPGWSCDSCWTCTFRRLLGDLDILIIIVSLCEVRCLLLYIYLLSSHGCLSNLLDILLSEKITWLLLEPRIPAQRREGAWVYYYATKDDTCQMGVLAFTSSGATKCAGLGMSHDRHRVCEILPELRGLFDVWLCWDRIIIRLFPCRGCLPNVQPDPAKTPELRFWEVTWSS